MKRLSTMQKISYFLFSLSGLMLLGTVYFVWNNIDVIKDWRLILPEQKIHVGDHVIVQSVYKKVRSADGIATRYLDCKNKDGVVLRYELNQRKADRKSGSGGTGIDVTMRSDVPDLPAKCRISVAISYETILPWYKHPETSETEEFTLYPKDEPTPPEITSGETLYGGSTGTNQTPVQVINPVDDSVSSSNPTPIETPPQSDNSQKGIIRSLLDNVTGLLK